MAAALSEGARSKVHSKDFRNAATDELQRQVIKEASNDEFKRLEDDICEYELDNRGLNIKAYTISAL